VYGDTDASRFGYNEHAEHAEHAEHDERDDGLDRRAGQRFSGAHGEMEWGDTPKKSFVLFGVDDDDKHA
jgi:palmitoyltransferase